MKQELRSVHEAKILATQLREVARRSLDEFSLDRGIVEAIVLARLLADAEDDIAEGRTRSFRLFFREFYKKL